MKFIDRVYGEIEITEPVVLKLIKSPSMQRLKGIDNAGYFEPYFPGSATNRFEHSFGVYILLKKYGAALEEQIAGLLHDVSHAAFSHCIDYVLDNGTQKEQSHQDSIFEEFVSKTEIPEILKKYGLDPEYILNENNFPLKEKNIPDLCADRIDYSLRNMLSYKEAEISEINYLLERLEVENGYWVFKNYESAKKFAELFLKMNRLYYAGLPTALMFKTLGDYLKYSLGQKYITPEDLYATDKKVLKKINKNLEKDKKLELLWDRVNNKIASKNDPNDFETHIFCKSRIVDPLCWHKGEIKRVSEIDPKWTKIVKQELKPKEYFLKFEK